MNKYIAIFCIPAASMKDWMSNVDETTRKEQMDQMMKDWNTWSEAHKDAILDTGSPLGKNMRVTKEGVEDIGNDMNYVMKIQAESPEAAAELIKGNPHVQMIPSAYVEIMQTDHMGAM